LPRFRWRRSDMARQFLRLQAAPGWSVAQRIRFGQLDRSSSGRIDDAEAVGFPLWQVDPGDEHRDGAELRGEIRLTDGWEKGVLVLHDHLRENVTAPPTAAPADKQPGSPWGGLSGALLFWRGIALGIVVEHLPWQGNAAITILPADRFLNVKGNYNSSVAAALGFPPGYEPPVVDDAEDSAEVTEETQEGYLQWVTDSVGTVPVLGWRDAPGVIKLLLDRVYVAMRLRPAKPAGWKTSQWVLRQPTRNGAARELVAGANSVVSAQVPDSQEPLSIWDIYKRNATTVVLVSWS
jgi:hypothetical protein